MKQYPIMKTDFTPAINQIKALQIYKNQCMQDVMMKSEDVMALKKQLQETLFSLEGMFSNTTKTPVREINLMKNIKNVHNTTGKRLIFPDPGPPPKAPSTATDNGNEIVNDLMRISKELETSTQASTVRVNTVTAHESPFHFNGNGKLPSPSNGSFDDKPEDPEISLEEIDNWLNARYDADQDNNTQRPEDNTQRQEDNARQEQQHEARNEGNAQNQHNGVAQQGQVNIPQPRPNVPPPPPPQHGNGNLQGFDANAELTRLKDALRNVSSKGELKQVIASIYRSPIYKSKANEVWNQQQHMAASVLDCLILKTGQIPDPSHTYTCEECGQSFTILAYLENHYTNIHHAQPIERNKATGIKMLIKCSGIHPT
jgi:hypothetical protein